MTAASESWTSNVEPRQKWKRNCRCWIHFHRLPLTEAGTWKRRLGCWCAKFKDKSASEWKRKTYEPWELHNVVPIGQPIALLSVVPAPCFLRSQQFNELHSLPIIHVRVCREYLPGSSASPLGSPLTNLNHLAFIRLTRSLQLPELCQSSIDNYVSRPLTIKMMRIFFYLKKTTEPPSPNQIRGQRLNKMLRNQVYRKGYEMW